MSPRLVRPAAAVVAALGLAALSACGPADDPTPPPTTTSSDELPPTTTDGSDTPTDESTTPDDGAAALPSGTRWATASRTGLRWAVPEDFTVVDAARLRSTPSTKVPKDVRDMARRQGMSVKEMLAAFGTTTEVVAVDQGGASGRGVTSNVNMNYAKAQSLPDEGEIRRQLANIPGSRTTVVSVEDEPLELGAANRTVYVMKVKDRKLAVEALAVEYEGGTATITATADSAPAAKALMDDIIDTIEPVGAQASASSSAAASQAA